ncbi:cytochrome ubiquinol oxidase subunit I [Streptomyces sp. 891-h]|uniref:cytochrome ubiquinol oxidase subunit I n=1 Tax=Streptomyces sp. 891-h TaxID=2720714 RepID=UPI001FAB3495|nr:cytochrome ubiquinol oxidase subunit I [Streptomyces sp. 891-h]UNZ16121.1 cytochrome ubiquinol oxidase subunit I [Streptomyces sp. 891-h]
MDPSLVARVQFAGTTGIHWLFVILTLGLVPLVAVMHTRAACARAPEERLRRERMTKFWGQLYVINYALGIVTGLVMEFQFGLSWSGLSKFAGNVFGAPLALETLIAFFAESTFLGMWIFGWGRLRPAVQVTLIWLVTLTAYASAYWILVANGFMQHPVGYQVRGERAYLTDFAAMLANPNALLALGHIALAALLTGGIFVAGISAWHLARGRRPAGGASSAADRALFHRSLRLGVLVAAFAGTPTYVVGALQYPLLEKTQPMKLALTSGEGVGKLAAAMAEKHGPGDYVPPGWAVPAQYLMLYLGYLLFTVAIVAAFALYRERLTRRRPVTVLAVAAAALPLSDFAGGAVFGQAGPYRWAFFLGCAAGLAAVLARGERLTRSRFAPWVLVAAIPLPFIASLGGWLFREGGRQPWLVYGELTVEDAVSPVGTGTLLTSCVLFLAVFLALAVANWTLLARFARRGPEGTQLGDRTALEPLSSPRSTATL